MSSNQMVSLIANDGRQVQASLQAVKQSIMLRNMFEDLDMATDVSIPIPEVKGNILEKCMEWCEKHRGDSYLPESKTELDPRPRVELREVPEEDSKFFSDTGSEVLVGIVNAANYLDIPLLLQYGISTIALQIQNLTTAEMCQYLNIETDFTPGEVERIRKDNEWASQSTVENIGAAYDTDWDSDDSY
ncbi:s-phase kinase-associated protein 1 [Nemania sp. FL0031]|nr:s-phase kinase-associated protein 1 [Nemania sp. FL0031]